MKNAARNLLRAAFVFCLPRLTVVFVLFVVVFVVVLRRRRLVSAFVVDLFFLEFLGLRVVFALQIF
jgi:hypothetical protein